MYLKALEIQGFKSFPDKTVLTFGEDITAIVGPNGSGKSNIADAILWVMGEQSTRALRGAKMEDVIFGGTAKRRQMGYAEVSLLLDNSAHIFDRPENEVMVTRRYYRSGESEYFINKSSCRLRDVNELFMDTGLGREGYSIIGQGKVDAILSQKSADRREIFEEAAGISRYRHRKEEAERKLGHTADNLLRISDKIEELELQVEPLREQSEKAQKYLIYRDELRGLEISLWMEQLDRLRENNRRLLHDYEAAVAQRSEAATARDALYHRSEQLGEQMQQQELALEQLRGGAARLEETAAELEAQIAVCRTQITHHRDTEDRLQSELTQQQGREDNLDGQIAERNTRLTEIRSRRDTLNLQMQLQREAWESIRRETALLEQELEQLRRETRMQDASAGEAKALLSALSAAEQELLRREETLQQTLSDVGARIAAAEESAREKQRQLEETRESCADLKNVISGYELRLNSRRVRLNTAGERAVSLTMEENALASRVNLLSEMEKVYEGYSKAVKTVMQAAQRGSLSGIHGPVAGLLKVPEQYAVAIEIALGGAMQNIVVAREEDGKNAISFLKRRDGGRATFLPMDAIRPGSLQERGLEEQYGFVGVASELISFAEPYRNIFSNLLGRVIVAEDMDSAISIARTYHHRYRIVTLDGQVLNAGGSMTGGSVSKNAGILSRANELERIRARLIGVQEQLKTANEAKAAAEREVKAAVYEMDVAKAQKQALENTALKLEGECGQYTVALEGLRRSAADAEQEKRRITLRMEENHADRDAALARIAALEGEYRALQAQEEGKASGEAALREKQSAVATAMEALKLELAALEAEESTVTQTVSELCALRSSLTEDRTRRQSLLEDCARQVQLLTAQIAQTEAALAARREEKTRLETEMHRVSDNRLQLESLRTQADRAARGKNDELLNMERDCARLEQRKTAAELEEKQLLDKLWDNYELSHSEAEKQRRELESVAKATRRIGELKRSIAALGAVNVGAIEEYRRVNERYTYLTDQREDVEKSKAELERIIDSITGRMKDIFARQFALISDSFTATFRELFGGGTASLELENKEDILNCGIEIRVQPPGKSLKIISLLSGGEKAFVAIALYFSILKVRPTPFVVLDEIEAALDDNNVTRFADYMRSMTDRTQFIVITHRRGTMEAADVLYGVTMQEQGITRMLTINLNDVERELHIR